MQGILYNHYKTLQECLQKLQQEELFNVPCEHAGLIAQHEEKLKEIYDRYQLAFEQVSLVIREYEKHKQSIRRLIVHHKGCRKSVNEKKILVDKFS